MSLEKYIQYGKLFEKYLRVNTFPIAIKLLTEGSEIPANAKRSLRDLGTQTFICQNFRMARSYGWTMVVTEEDCVCLLARGIYGWDPISQESIKFGNKFSEGLYSKDVETAEIFSKGLNYLDKKILGLVISPLTRTKVEPDVVQIYCNPAQAMRLIQAYLYFEGGSLQFTAAGRVGSCHDGVITPYLTQKPQLVILGNGDRVWGGAEDTEVMFAIPKSKLELITKGLETTHAAGLRYPIPKYMNYKPGFQTKFKKRAVQKSGGTIVKGD